MRPCYEVSAQAFDGAQSRRRSNKSIRGRGPTLPRARGPRRRLASNNPQRDRGKAHHSEISVPHRTKVTLVGQLEWRLVTRGPGETSMTGTSARTELQKRAR